MNLFFYFSEEHFRRRQKIMKKSRSCVQSIYSSYSVQEVLYAMRVATRTHRQSIKCARKMRDASDSISSRNFLFTNNCLFVFTSDAGSFEYNIEFLLNMTDNSCPRYCCPICFLHCPYLVYLSSKHVKAVTEGFIAHYFLLISRS